MRLCAENDAIAATVSSDQCTPSPEGIALEGGLNNDGKVMCETICYGQQNLS